MYVAFALYPKCDERRFAALAMSVCVGLLGTAVVSFH